MNTIIIARFCTIGLIVSAVSVSSYFLLNDVPIDFESKKFPVITNDVDQLLKTGNEKR